MKDPAFLFYPSDFLIGTDDMTNEEIGCYIRLLCWQADRGALSDSKIKKICGELWDKSAELQSKFTKQTSGKHFNKRLQSEIEKRKNYCNSRRDNRLNKKHMSNIRKTYEKRMENEDVNVNVNKKENNNIINNIYNYWDSVSGKRQIKRTAKRTSHINARLNEYAESEIKQAIDYIVNSQWHIENGHVNLDIIIRSTEQVEKYLGKTEHNCKINTGDKYTKTELIKISEAERKKFEWCSFEINNKKYYKALKKI